MTASTAYQIVPTNEAPSQTITVSLNGQSCLINLYTKSTNVPIAPPGALPSIPPIYQNINPCFVDLYVSGGLVIGGVYVRQSGLIVRDTYLGFVGDLSVIDTSGAGEDPFGVPPILPPAPLRNPWELTVPLSLGDLAPPNVAGRIPGMGSRWVLTYWPPGSYNPGYSLPR